MLREGEIEGKYKTPAGGIILRAFFSSYLVSVVHGVVDVEFTRWVTRRLSWIAFFSLRVLSSITTGFSSLNHVFRHFLNLLIRVYKS